MSKRQNKAYITQGDVFATRLRKAMGDKSMTQVRLAQMVGIQRQTVSLYRQGQSKPDTENLSKIAKALDVTSDYLIGLSPTPSKNVDIQELTEWLKISDVSARSLCRFREKEWAEESAAFNAFLESPASMEIFRKLALCMRFERSKTPYELELERQGRYPSHIDGVASMTEADKDNDRNTYIQATLYSLQTLIADIAKSLLEKQKTAPGADDTEDGQGQN